MPTLTGQPSSPARTRSIAYGGSSKPAVMSVVTPPDSAGGSSSGSIVWTCVSTPPGVAIRPYAMYGFVFGPDHQVDAVADLGAARPADAGDPAVLDADVGLDHAEDGIHDERAGEHEVELRRAGRRVRLRHPHAQVLGVAPDRLVAAGGAVLLDADPEVGVAEADAVACGRRRSGCGTPPRTGGSPGSAPGRSSRPCAPAGRSSSRRAPSPRRRRRARRAGSRAPPRGRTRAAG